MKLPYLHQNTGIYIIICIVSLKFYIGSSVNLRGRFRSHKHELENNCHGNSRLQNAWNKYGKDTFVFGVLEHCEKSVLIAREQFYLDRYRASDSSVGFNLNPKAESRLGIKASPETIVKMKESRKGTRLERTKFNIEANGREFEIVSPTGELVRYRGLSEFCRLHGLKDASLFRVLRGDQDSARGWHLSGTVLPIYPDKRLRDPNGDIHIIKHGKLAPFCRQHSLNQGNINQVALGKTASCKGWTRAED